MSSRRGPSVPSNASGFDNHRDSIIGAKRTIISAVAVALLLALMVVPPLVVSMRERGCREPAEHREASLVRRAFPSTKRFYFD